MATMKPPSDRLPWLIGLPVAVAIFAVLSTLEIGYGVDLTRWNAVMANLAYAMTGMLVGVIVYLRRLKRYLAQEPEDQDTP